MKWPKGFGNNQNCPRIPQKSRSLGVIVIFGNKVAQILWSSQSFAFVLESAEIKESFMRYFKHFWKDPW